MTDHHTRRDRAASIARQAGLGALAIVPGPIAADCHGTPGAHTSAAGEPVLIDFGTSFDGMNADITRAIYETVAAANAHGKAIAAPGVTCHTLDAKTTRVPAASPHADMIVHKTRHGLGLDVHEAPQVMLGNHTVLEPGMVITIEPGLYPPGEIGVRIEDDVLMTETGCESLTTFPRKAQCFG